MAGITQKEATLGKVAMVIIGTLMLVGPVLRPELSDSLKFTALIGGAVFFVGVLVIDLAFRVSKLEKIHPQIQV